MPHFADDLPEVLDNAREAGIERVVVIGYDVESSKRTVALADQYDMLLAAVGVHPHDASSVSDSDMEELRKLAKHPKVVAIGETGYDFHYNNSPAEKQADAFEAHVALAVETQLPIIIHDREAHEATVDVISKYADKLVGGVLHCFSGDIQLAKQALDWGFYISIAGPVTYPNAKGLRSVVEKVPTERMVIETDAPYLAPQQKRGKRNEPALVRFVAEEIARVKGLSFQDVDRITTLSAMQLFGLPIGENGDVIVYPIRDSLYINVTAACTNECSFCVRFKSPYVKGHNLSLKRDRSASEILDALAGERLESYNEVVFCGLGEPLLRLDVIKQVGKKLKKDGCKIRINTNGQGNLIHGRNIVPELEGLVDAVSVSLNNATAERYYQVCKPKFGPETFDSILDFVRECKKYIPEVSVTALDIDHEDFEACKRLAEKDLGVRFRERYYNEVG